MMQEKQIKVVVVDDDAALRDSIVWLLEGEGMRVRAFASAEDFLAHLKSLDASVLVLDVRMPGMTGTELQDELARRKVYTPIIFITGHGDVPMAVEAIKRGAFDFIEKPFNDAQLVKLIQRAAERASAQSEELESQKIAHERLAKLSPREREVLELVVKGKLNKTIADVLGISIKTVEAHRARVMEKMQVNSLAELVQLTLKALPGKDS
jgi:RNA polymerase sigma factor (sigma-70 family)